jgi:peroxin-13
MPSPPKPWERTAGAVSVATTAPPITAAPAAQPSTTTSSDPSIPPRPTSLASTSAPATASYTNTLNPLNSAYNSYASPYSRIGTSYSPYSSYGSYGGYGTGYGTGYGGYGGYGGMGVGMNSMFPGMGMAGLPYDPNNPQASLTQLAQNSTSQTFALLQSIVQTFTSFAQLLDSTFVATHSSFFAMIGVADQLGQLKGMLGQVIGVFGLVGWLRGWWSGDRSGASMKQDFKRFLQGGPPAAGGPGQPPKPSRKPLLFFLLAVFGLPYLMHRFIKHLSSRLPPPPSPSSQPGAPLDPSQLTFARAIHPFNTTDPVELSLGKGEIVAVLGTTDPVTGVEGEWWRGRTREGREGWFPKSFVEVIKPREAISAAPAEEVKKVV